MAEIERLTITRRAEMAAAAKERGRARRLRVRNQGRPRRAS
jgi:hypothetical protein